MTRDPPRASPADDGGSPVLTRRRLLGATGGAAAALAAGAGTAAAQESGGTLEMALVDFAYEPGTESPARIPPGTTVTFVWETPTHNIVVTSQPEGADWAGHEPIEDTGFEVSHTFEVEGTYEFHCAPHESLGMVGTIVVDSEATLGGGEEGGLDVTLTPELVTFAVALGAAVLSPLLFGWFLRRRGRGRDVPEVELAARRADRGPPPATEEAEPFADVVREIPHDEFDPTGTATLVVLYLLLLVVLWVFTYFVEFLGRGPTVIG